MDNNKSSEINNKTPINYLENTTTEHIEAKSSQKKFNTQIFKNKHGNNYKWFVSNFFRNTLTVMDPKQLNLLMTLNQEGGERVIEQVKNVFTLDPTSPMEFLGICEGRFVGIDPLILYALNDVNNALQAKMGANSRITEIVFTKNLEKMDWMIVPSSASQEKLQEITNSRLMPSNVYNDKYGEVDNYISGYNVELDTENFAKKYGYEHLVNKELPIANAEATIPVVTLTRDDIIETEIIETEIDNHGPLTPNVAEV